MKSNDRGTKPGSLIFTCCPSPQAKRTFFYPLYLGHYYCNAEYRVARNRLDSFLLMYVHSGNGFVTDSSGTHALSQGDFLLLDCYAPHAYYTNTEWDIYWIHFDGPTARDMYEYALHRRRLIVPSAHRPLLHRFSKLLSLYEEGHVPDEVLVSKLINDLLTDLLLPMEKDRTPEDKVPLIDECVRYVSEHFDEKLTLEMLAAQVNMSPFYFAHIFRNEIGMSVHQYLIHIRLEYSRYLLQTGNMAVQDIAERCGFSNAGAFCASFKQHMGCSPGEYRRQYL